MGARFAVISANGRINTRESTCAREIEREGEVGRRRRGGGGEAESERTSTSQPTGVAASFGTGRERSKSTTAVGSPPSPSAFLKTGQRLGNEPRCRIYKSAANPSRVVFSRENCTVPCRSKDRKNTSNEATPAAPFLPVPSLPLRPKPVNGDDDLGKLPTTRRHNVLLFPCSKVLRDNRVHESRHRTTRRITKGHFVVSELKDSFSTLERKLIFLDSRYI